MRRKGLALLGLFGLLLGHIVAGVNSTYGIVTVTTAGVPVQIAKTLGYTSNSCLQVIVTGDPANTGTIYLGMGSDVSSSKYFVAMGANVSFNSGPSGTSPRFPCQDLWADASINGQKVDVLILPGEVKQ